MWRFLIIFLFLNSIEIVVNLLKLQRQYNWKYLDYQFDNDNDRVRAMISGDYIPKNNLPVGIEIWGNKLFISVPRWRPGIPSTLNYIHLDDYQTSDAPLLRPYPDWQTNKLGNCLNGLNTVYRIHADKCNRLWVLDTGTFGIGNTTQNICPYSINVFNLFTNQIIRRYQLKSDDINDRTFIANIAVEINDDCNDAYAYFSDELGYGLIVYSYKLNKSWRFEHGFFYPDPLAGDFNINGLNFQWFEEGIFGMSLSPLIAQNQRLLYFSPLASFNQFYVNTNILKNESKTEDSYHDFYLLNYRGDNTHCTAQTMSSNGIQLFNIIDRNAIGCWNSLLPFHPNTIDIVDYDHNELIFPADVKIDGNNNVWIISDRMSDFLLSDLDYNEINFRIFKAPLNILIAGTLCDPNLNFVAIAGTRRLGHYA